MSCRDDSCRSDSQSELKLTFWDQNERICPAGMIAVALTPNLKIAAVCTSYMVTVFHLFAGFVITQPNMPGWW